LGRQRAARGEGQLRPARHAKHRKQKLLDQRKLLGKRFFRLPSLCDAFDENFAHVSYFQGGTTPPPSILPRYPDKVCALNVRMISIVSKTVLIRLSG
jgi:hypothetical protein